MMSELDLILRGGTVVSATELRQVDHGVADGKIIALEPNLQASSPQEIDASGLHIFPGLIDAHVHFNEPGRAHWEGFETGSRALAAGGGTMFFDMPLNSSPPTLDADSFDQKRRAAEKSSLVDFALWGGLVPDNLDRLDELSERGVIGFKAFMANSGIEDFPCVNDRELREGMKRAAQLGKIVAVHAESDSITSELTQQRLFHKATSIRDYLESRPIHAELDAIGRALEMAVETGCALHIVHVSCGAGIALIVAAQSLGVDVSCETCPHYLALTEEDMERIGAVAKCAPPLRPAAAQETLWQYLQSGHVTTVGSDHSPSPPDMKADQNFFKVWGGISGVQHTLPILLSRGSRGNEAQTERGSRSAETETGSQSLLTSAATNTKERGLALSLIAKLTSFNVAERFQLPRQIGRIEIGADADLALVDLKQKVLVKQEDLFYRHRQSPYVGRSLTGKVVQTILRGQTVFKDGKIVSNAMGRFVKPLNR